MTAPLASARGGHTATLLSPGRVLVVGGSGSNGVLSGAELFDLTTGSWAATGSLSQSRRDHSATVLPSGKVLVVGGAGTSDILAEAEVYDPATGLWSATGSLAQARKGHTATLLSSGQVLVVGGEGSSGRIASAELYDPATGAWSATGSLVQERSGATATLLPSGEVLVAGGEGSSGTLTSAEVYDPATGTWTATGSLAQAREGHAAMLLPSGKVLVAGGAGPAGALSGAELYDPATGAWVATGSLVQGRSDATATLLPSGKVLVAGGEGSSGTLTSAEVYDPVTGSWASSLSLSQARALHTATLLPSGKVFVVGGEDPSGALTSTELYDPAAGSWGATGSFSQERYNAAATLLPSGKVLVVGGTDLYLRGAQLYDPATRSWSATGPINEFRAYPTATLLPTGKVLLAGGLWGSGGYRASAELYDPATGSWTATSSLSLGRFCHTSTLLPSGKVLVVGGFGSSGYLTSAEVYDPATGTWSTTGSLNQGRACHTATLLPDGRVLAVSSLGDWGPTASAELYDPATGTWTPTASLAHSHREHTATLLQSGKVLVVGGYDADPAARASAELFDPATGTWTATGSLNLGRRNATATLLPSGQVLVVGGDGFWPVAADNAELYDPVTGAWTVAGSTVQQRIYHTATLLPSGQVLVTGGRSSPTTSEIFDGTGANPAWRPVMASVSASAPLTPGSTFTVSGALLRGVSEASGGGSRSSPTDFPLLTLLDMEGVQWSALPVQDFSGTHISSRVPQVPPGPHLLSVTVNGLTSSHVIDIAAGADSVPPTVTLTAPIPGATLKGTVVLSAPAFDNVAVARVEFYDGATKVGMSVAPPFNFSWSSRTVANGFHVLSAQAHDAAGNFATSLGVNVTVDNDLIPPSVAISAPESGATVAGTVPVTVVASDNLEVARVELYEGSTLVGTDTSSPYSIDWNTRTGVNGERTITAKAYDTEGNTAVATVTVTADNDFVPPTVALTSPGAGATLTGTVVFTATASDASGISRVVFHSDGGWMGTATTAPYSVSYNTRSHWNGSAIIWAEAYDAAGNWATSAQVSVSFNNDFTPPTVTMTAPAANATLSGTVVFTATASDAAGVSRVEFLVDGSGSIVGTDTTAPYSFSFDTRSLANGSHMIGARAWDPLYNVGYSAWVSVTVNNDFTPPTVTLTAPAAGATLKGTVNVQATATDNIAVTRVEFYDGATLLGTDTTSPFVFSWNTRTAANGAHALTAKAYDAWAQSTTSAVLNVTLDNDLTAPTVAFTAPAAGSTVSGSVTLTATATDNVSVTRVEFHEGTTLVGSDTVSPYSLSWNTRTGPNGDRTLTAKAYDAVGNIGVATVTVTANNDLTAPTVALTAPTEGETLTGTVVLTATASDDRAVTRVAFFVGTTQVGTDSTAPYTLSYNTRNLPNGAKVLTAKAYDAVNNVGTSAPVSVNFSNDFTPPTVALTAPGEGDTLTGTVVFSATASDAAGISKVLFFVGTTQVGSVTTAPYAFSYNTRNLPSGAKVLTAKAYDTLNNVATSAAVNVTFDNDLTPPTSSITSPSSGSTLSGVVRIDATASDGTGTVTKVEFFQGSTLLGTDTTAPYSWDWDTSKASTGSQTLKTRAWDAAGNSAYSTAVTVTVTR